MPDSKNPLDDFRTPGGDDWFSKLESEESKFASRSVQESMAKKPVIAPSLRMPSHGENSGKVLWSGPHVGSWGEELPPSNAPIDLTEEEPKTDQWGNRVPTPAELASSENMATHTKDDYETGPSGKPTKAEEYAIRGGVADKINTAFDKSYAPDFVKDAHRAIVDTIAPGIESSIAALVGSTGKPLGVVDRVLANMLAKRFNVPDYAKKFSEEHNVNSITAGYNARTDVMKVSGGRTDDIKKLKPEEREALRSGTLDNILGKIERATTTEDSWGEKTKWISVDPGAADRWGAEMGPAIVGSLPLMAAGAAAGGAVGAAAAGSKAVAGVANFITKSPVLSPFLKKIGIASAEEAATVMANLVGAQAGSSVEALGEAGSVYDKLVSEGMGEAEAAEQASKVFVANQLLLGFTNNVGPTAKVVKGLISAGRSAEAEAIAKTALKEAYKSRLLPIGQAAILKEELKTKGKKAAKAAGETIWEATKDAFSEGFMEEQGQKVISDLAEQGKPFTWDNIVDTYIKNWDEGVLGGIIGVAMGGGSKALEARDVRGYEKKIADFKARNKEYVPIASRTNVEFTNQKKPSASTGPSTPVMEGTNATAAPKETKATVTVAAPKTEAPKPQTFSSAPATGTTTASAPVAKNALVPHPNTVLLTASYGDAGKVESIKDHTPDTSHTVANRGVAQSMFSILAGSIKESGGEINDETKAKIHSITNALSMPGAITKVTGALKEEGVPAPVIEALIAAKDVLKGQGLDVNRSTLGKDSKPIPAKDAADRNWRLLNEFHAQLAPRVQAMGVDAPSWLRESVAKIEKIIAPGSKYDTAYRKGMGMPVREAEVQSVSTPPIVKPKSVAPKVDPAAPPKRTDLVDKVERSEDPDELAAQEAGLQVNKPKLPAIQVGPVQVHPSIEGRKIKMQSKENGPHKKPVLIEVHVMSDGDLVVKDVQNGGFANQGVGKALYKAAVKLALEHFPGIVTGENQLIGMGSPFAVASRTGYKGTQVLPGTIEGSQKIVVTPIKSILEHKYTEPAKQEEALTPEGLPILQLSKQELAGWTDYRSGEFMFPEDMSAVDVARKQGVLYRGLNEETMDRAIRVNDDGSLTLLPQDNMDGQTTGVSTTPYRFIAWDYATRDYANGTSKHASHIGVVLTINTDKKLLAGAVDENGEEVSFPGEITIPRGQWELSRVSQFSSKAAEEAERGLRAWEKEIESELPDNVDDTLRLMVHHQVAGEVEEYEGGYMAEDMSRDDDLVSKLIVAKYGAYDPGRRAQEMMINAHLGRLMEKEGGFRKVADRLRSNGFEEPMGKRFDKNNPPPGWTFELMYGWTPLSEFIPAYYTMYGKEQSNAETTEGSTSTEGTQQAPAVDRSQRSEVPQSGGTSEIAGTRADDPRGESRPVLGESAEASGPELTPEQQARLDQLRALLQDDLGTDNVRTLHDEMVEDASKYSAPTESKDGFGAPRVGPLYGHNGLLYPAQAELPGSPYTRVLNLTPNNYLNPEFAKAMGLSWKLSDSLPLPGSALLALLTRNEDGWNQYRKLLAALGFDAVAYEDSPGNTVITGINDAADPEVATPNTRKDDLTPGSLPKFDKTKGLWSTGSTLRPAPMRVGPRAWGKKADGSFGWLREGPRATNPKGVSSTSERNERLGPESYTQPIADEMERDMAVIEAANLVQNNHFTITELLKLARQAGVPITDTDFQRLMDRDDVETGVADKRQLQGLDPIADDSGDRRTFTPGELTHKFVEYIKDGGFADVIYRLSKSSEFLAAIGTPGKLAQYGENQYLSVARALATNGSIQEALGLTDKGSGSVYRTTRAMLNSAVDGLLQDPPKYSGALAKAMSNPKMWQVHSKLMALAAVAAAQYIPDFFYVSSKRLEEMRKKEMEDGAYDDEPKVPVLSNHMELVQEHQGSFAPTIDAKTDRLGANHGSSDNPNEPTMNRLPYQGAVDGLIQGIAERGGFSQEALAKAGVVLHEKTPHSARYRALVEEVEMDVDAVMRLEKEGVSSLLHMPPHLVQSGYAGLMLAHRTGRGKREFHADAPRIDPNYDKFYTVGEDTIIKTNAWTNDGMPVPEHIMSNLEIMILLDKNHPMHDVTVENVNTKLTTSADIMLAGTPMRRVVFSHEIPNPKYVAPAYEMRPDDYGDEYRHYTEEGNKEPKMIKVGERSMLVPRNRIHGEYSSVRGITAGVPAQAAAGLSYPGIRITNQKVVAQRLKAALARLGTGDPKWMESLGTDLIDQLATAKTAMDIINSGQSIKAGASNADDIAFYATQVSGAKKKLAQFITDTENRIKSGNNNSAEVAARARAQEIFSVLEKAKSDVPWDDIFNGIGADGMPLTIPVSVAKDCVRNKEQFMKVAEEIMTEDDKAYTLSVLDKIHPLFFEELGTNISSDPNLASAAFYNIKRIIKVAGKLKGNISNSNVGHMMSHELAHALTTFMGIPMQAVADRWFRSERERFYQGERRASAANGEGGRSRLEDVLGADAIDPTTRDIVSVSDVMSNNGTLSEVVITPEAREEIVSRHPSMEKHLPVTTAEKQGSERYDEDGDLIGYGLSPHFAGHRVYRYMNLAEFIAETMKEALIDHARGISKRPKKDYDTRDRYKYRLNQNGGAKTVMDAVHRNIGRMIDTIVGKNTMRRYVGYLVNNAGSLEQGLKSNNTRDIAFPAMDWRGKDSHIFRGGRAGAPPGPVSAEDLAKRDHLMMRRIGNWVNVPRAKLMTQMNAASVSDKSRAGAYTMRQVLGDLGLDYTRISQALYEFYDRAHEMTVIDRATRKWLIDKAENSQTAAKAKAEGYANTITVTAPNGKIYFVGINAAGKYVDATPFDNVKSWMDYEQTGKFSGPLAGMEEIVEPINKMVWGRMSMAIANLADKLSIDADNLADFDELVKKVQHYFPHQHRSKIEGGFRELTEKKDGNSADTGLGEFNTGMNPAVDYGINAHMLMARTFDNSMEAIANGHFPIHANAVENVMSGAANAMGVIARLDAVAGLLDKSLAVPEYDGSPETQKWGTLKLATTGLTKEMFGKALANIRVHPDAERTLVYSFKPEPLARTSFGRYMAMISGAMNVFQLFGLNDYVNGMAAVSGFAAQLGFKGSMTKSILSAGLRRGLVSGAAAAGGMASLAIGTGMAAGVVVGGLTAMGLYTLFNKIRPMSANTYHATAEGRKAMGIVTAADLTQLSKSDLEIRQFFGIANVKLAEGPIQVARMGKMVSELARQGKGVQSSLHYISNALNKPTQWNEIGFGAQGSGNPTLMGKSKSLIPSVGGKAMARLGMIKLIAPHIMDKYRDENGNVNFDDPGLRREATQLSDDMDNQVGAIQYRNLHMNPTIVSYMKTIFRAFGFRFTTEKLIALMIADVVNNIGTHLPFGGGGAFTAFREHATGGGTDRPVRESGWALRQGTIALGALMMMTMVASRMQAMMSHMVWPDANFQQSDFARRTYEQLQGKIGKKPAKAFEGILAVLPPEGSSWGEGIRHAALETFASQAERSDPTTGRPRHMIPPGAMYARNIYDSPLFVTGLKSDGIKMYNWLVSGLNPVINAAWEVAMDQDGLKRPLGFGDPFRNIAQVRKMNEWMERHPGDDPFLAAARYASRSAAHIGTSLLPFGARGVSEWAPYVSGGTNEWGEGSWYPSVMATLGGRSMAPEASLTAAERLAYESITYGDKARTHEQVSRSTAERSAKMQMLETGKTDKLKGLKSKGLLGKDKKASDKEENRLKKEFLEKPGDPRANVVRLMRKVQDSSKTTWKDIYLVSTPAEKEEIKKYVKHSVNTVTDQTAKAKLKEFQDWIKKRGDK